MTVSDIVSDNVEEVRPSEERPQDQPFDVPILPLKDTVVYPLTVVPWRWARRGPSSWWTKSLPAIG